MARDTETIYQEMLTEKQSRPELDVLDTPSNTGLWQLILRLLAQIHNWMEVKLDNFKIEIQEVVDSSQFGNFPWWRKKVLEFQFGDQLAFINNRFVYPSIDLSKRIIKYVSISDERGIVKVKAAKEDNGRPLELDTQEAAGLVSYLREIRPPGTRLVVESLPADKLKTTLVVQYSAQLDVDLIKESVEAVYLNYINTLDFDGVYYVNKMIDAIQAIPGIIEEQVRVVDISAKQGSDPYTSFSSKYQAKSGYFEIDADFPLSSTITYKSV